MLTFSSNELFSITRFYKSKHGIQQSPVTRQRGWFWFLGQAEVPSEPHCSPCVAQHIQPAALCSVGPCQKRFEQRRCCGPPTSVWLSGGQAPVTSPREFQSSLVVDVRKAGDLGLTLQRRVFVLKGFTLSGEKGETTAPAAPWPPSSRPQRSQYCRE